MTNRNTVTISWASDVAAFVVDPDTDASHASGQGGAGKYSKGWVAETEPQQWENHIIKLREDRNTSILTNGCVPWDEEVNYKVKAVTTKSGVMYVALLGDNLDKDPEVEITYWSPIKFPTADVHTTTIYDMTGKYTAHTIPSQNSHNDDIVSIGGSYKATINTQVQAVADATATHTALTNNPHTDTAIEVGTIPSAGGSFTGRVNYLDNISLGTNCELMTNISTFVAFRSLAGAIGLGIANYNLGGRWQRIFTADSFPRVNCLYNGSFVMPRPDLHFPLMSDLNAVYSTGTLSFTRNTTLGYTNKSNNAQTAPVDTPAFEVAGLKLTAATSLLVVATGLFGARDGCISYTLNGVVIVKDVQFTNSNLVSYTGTTGNLKNFRVWSQRLSPRQKLSIPR